MVSSDVQPQDLSRLDATERWMAALVEFVDLAGEPPSCQAS
jgi:hypothetical protein